METRLTNDGAHLLHVLYQSYASKRKSGKTKREANYFSNSHYIHEYLLPDWHFEDVDDTCRELSRANLIRVLWADNIANDIRLTDEAISIMENIVFDTLKDTSSIISAIISAVGSFFCK